MAAISNKKVFYGLFDDDAVLLKAVKNIRAEGYNIFNVFTPFPVHHLDEALGLKKTRLHTVGFIFGASGTTLALAFMGWVSVTNYPINFGGKPLFALPAFIPITFELTVLFASVGMVLAYLFVNRLAPGMSHDILDPRTTSHLFAVAFEIDESTSEAQVNELKGFLEENGAIEFGQKDIAVEEEDFIQQIL